MLYAVIDNDGRCCGFSELSGAVDLPTHVPITDYAEVADKMWKDGKWVAAPSAPSSPEPTRPPSTEERLAAIEKQQAATNTLLAQVAMATVVAPKTLPDAPPDLPPVPEISGDLPPIGDVTGLDAETLKALMGGGAGATVPDMPMPPTPSPVGGSETGA